MLHLGDYDEDNANVNFAFLTRRFDTNVPATLSGTPVISVYKGNATSGEKTSAESYITLNVDHDSVTGLNHVEIDLSGDAFFAVDNDYYVIVSTGTVNSVSEIGRVIAVFSIENRILTSNKAQPGQATPAANASMVVALQWLFKNWRNKKDQTATTFQLYNDDASTVDQKSTVADDATTASRTEIETGP